MARGLYAQQWKKNPLIYWSVQISRAFFVHEPPNKNVVLQQHRGRNPLCSEWHTEARDNMDDIGQFNGSAHSGAP
ncbi:hypothetical protein CEXT_137811 [Caerostris extrusa]|uniref:Uncharacterized protein n=1 Tax=Caerostris extrusa TaxID=172846 RepID=A0AAV4NC28_CAEEX|nr:hypothetical protein CEXT_137811 [Caerostris extrusa]